MNRKWIVAVLPALVALALVFFWLRGRRAGGEDARPPGASEGIIEDSLRGVDAAGNSSANPEMIDAGMLAHIPLGAGYRVERYEDPERGAIAGNVTDITGCAVPGLAVEILPSAVVSQGQRNYVTEKIFTDKNGFFLFPNVEPRSYYFLCGTVKEILPVKAGTKIVRDVQLPGGASVSGYVQDADSRRLFPAYVYLLSGRNRLVCRTDEKGAFLLQGVTPDNYRLAARCDGYIPSEFKTCPIKELERVQDIVFTLETGGVLTGYVRDDRGRPVPGVRVSTETLANRMGAVMGVSDDRGYFELQGLPPGSQPLLLEKEGFLPRPGPTVNIVAGQRSSVAISWTEGLRLAGLVTVAGGDSLPDGMSAALSLQAGANRRAGAMSVAVGADGRFAFEGLSEGDYRVTLSFTDGRYTIPEGKMVKVAEMTESSVAFQLERGGQVNGLVVERAGKPVPNASVTLVSRGAPSSGGYYSVVLKTDDSGCFRAQGVPPGTVTLDCKAPGYLSGVRETFTLTPGGTLAPSLVLDFGGGIEGAVLDARGNGRSGVVLYARQIGDASFANLPKGVSGADGRYVLSGLPEGRYTVYALWPDSRNAGRMQTVNQQVQVARNAVAKADFRLPE